jgi:UDP-N-acetylglucosamine/UDP-N-acetyl-alpha-D-glucosaminouronate 4-epimerase
VNALVTGGAGFIGSHIADALLARGGHVRILDDLSNGRLENVPAGAELLVGDVADPEAVAAAVHDVEIVFHEAALGSVKRSVESPLPTDTANAHGSLTVLDAAHRAGVRRVVAASSSSVYGGVAPLPSREDHPRAPKSPYAVTKVALELYAQVYAELIGLETVCLRYFNVYGPRQRSDSAYAAVVPLFIEALRTGARPVIYGDGLQSRDFTFVGDVVEANLLAAQAPADRCSGRIYNVAGSACHSVLELLTTIGRLLDVDPDPVHEPSRAGDVRDSQADLSAAADDLGYKPSVSLEEGLRRLLATAT